MGPYRAHHGPHQPCLHWGDPVPGPLPPSAAPAARGRRRVRGSSPRPRGSKRPSLAQTGERLRVPAHRTGRLRALRQALSGHGSHRQAVPVPLLRLLLPPALRDQRVPPDRLRAEELEARVVESLLTTLKRRELLQDAVTRWMQDVAELRPKRERELAAVDVRLRKVEGSVLPGLRGWAVERDAVC